MEPSREIRPLLSWFFFSFLLFSTLVFHHLYPGLDVFCLVAPVGCDSWPSRPSQSGDWQQLRPEWRTKLSSESVRCRRPSYCPRHFYLKHLLLLEYLCLAFNLQRKREQGGKYSAQFLAWQHQKHPQMINQEAWFATERSSKKNHHQEPNSRVSPEPQELRFKPKSDSCWGLRVWNNHDYYNKSVSPQIKNQQRLLLIFRLF